MPGSFTTRYDDPPTNTTDPFIRAIWPELSLQKRMDYYVTMEQDSETELETQAVVDIVRNKRQIEDKQENTNNIKKRRTADEVATSSSNFTSARSVRQDDNLREQASMSAHDKGNKSTVRTYRSSHRRDDDLHSESWSDGPGHSEEQDIRASIVPEDPPARSQVTPTRDSTPINSTLPGGRATTSSGLSGGGRGLLVAKRGRNLKRASARSGRLVETKLKSSLFDLAKAPLKTLTPQLKELKTFLSQTVRMFLKDLTGIVTKKKKNARTAPLLPDPPQPGDLPRLNQSGLPYMNPCFDEDVASAANNAIITKAARLALANITESQPDIVTLTNHDVPVRMKLLCDLGKITFRGWADKYQGQVNSTKKKMRANNQQVARRTCRKEQQFRRRTWAVKRFISVYKFDPTPMLHVDWMSDEESGPDPEDMSDEEETREEWLGRMDRYLGVKRGEDGERTVSFEVLQVVEPAWRTDWVSNVLHELSRIHYRSLTAVERKNYKYQRVKNSGKLNDVPSLTIPFDFMVDKPWWKKVKESGQYEEYLEGWMSRYEDPPEFRTLPAFEPVDTLPDFDDDFDEEEEEEEEYQADVE